MPKLANQLDKIEKNINDFLNGMISMDIQVNIILKMMKEKDPELFKKVGTEVLEKMKKKGVIIEGTI